MKQIALICAGCNTEFLKPAKEVNRQKKFGRTDFWCTISCFSKTKGHCNVDAHKGKHGNNLFAQNRLDEYSLFRPILKRIRTRYKEKQYGSENNLTLEYLKELWESQNGICPYTKVKLKLVPYTGKLTNPNFTASLDRIDNSLGYSKGNVQFVSLTLNWLKNSGDDSHISEFIGILKSL